MTQSENPEPSSKPHYENPPIAMIVFGWTFLLAAGLLFLYALEMDLSPGYQNVVNLQALHQQAVAMQGSFVLFVCGIVLICAHYVRKDQP